MTNEYRDVVNAENVRIQTLEHELDGVRSLNESLELENASLRIAQKNTHNEVLSLRARLTSASIRDETHRVQKAWSEAYAHTLDKIMTAFDELQENLRKITIKAGD